MPQQTADGVPLHELKKDPDSDQYMAYHISGFPWFFIFYREISDNMDLLPFVFANKLNAYRELQKEIKENTLYLNARLDTIKEAMKNLEK